MKIFRLILLINLAVFSNIYAQDIWEKTNELNSIEIYSLAINSNGDIFAGTDMNGLYRSTDNGDSWTNLGFTNTWIQGNGIAISPSEEILIATDNKDATGGVFRSTNNGNNWNTLGLTYNAEISIAINSSGDIFAGTAAQGVYRSTDNGQNFVQINQGLDTSSGMNPISFTINTSGHIFVGTVSGGVFRSTNNGNNWVQLNQGITNYQILSLVVNTNGNIFAGTSGGGIFRSIDNGNNWVQINQGLTYTEGYFVRSLAINSNGDIFAGTADGVFRSIDNGNNWVKINQGLTNTGVLSLAINPNGSIFAGTLDGVFRTVISANIKVFLEGPYAGGGAMTTTLNTNNLIPLSSNDAYSTAVYGYTASTVGSIPNSNIVDWVLVELRTGTASGTKVGTRAGFLKSDGKIVDVDGVSPLRFNGVNAGNYYVVVRHRNHLAIMSANAIPLSGSSALYDFSTSQSQAYTPDSDPLVALSGGGFGMVAADANNSAIVTAADVTPIIANLNATIYNGADINMSAIVTAADVTKIISNLNRVSKVPN
jgi:ligand-binding sensor domain-containing protein